FSRGACAKNRTIATSSGSAGFGIPSSFHDENFQDMKKRERHPILRRERCVPSSANDADALPPIVRVPGRESARSVRGSFERPQPLPQTKLKKYENRKNAAA